MDIQMSAPKEPKPKAVLFHISQSLFKNKRLKRRLTGVTKKKTPKKRQRTRRKQEINGRPPPQQVKLEEPIEILSTDEECEPPKPEVETSIILSSDEEDELATKTRIFPMLESETTVRTAVGNTVYELSLTQLKENLETIIMKDEERGRSTSVDKRLNNTGPTDVSISLLSEDEEEEQEADKEEDN